MSTLTRDDHTAISDNEVTLESLRDDLNAVKRSITQLGARVADAGYDAAALAKSNLIDAARVGREKAVLAGEQVRGSVSDRPFTWIGAAFGVGLVAGWMCRRR